MPSPGRRGCSTSTSIQTTTGRSTRWSASGDELVESLVAGIAAAVDRIDLRRHVGAHPRIGAADVVPLIPIRPEDEPYAREAALTLADRLGDELELPVFFYGRLTEDGREPRSSGEEGPDELQRRIDAGELAPDRGPHACIRQRAASCSGSGGP